MNKHNRLEQMVNQLLCAHICTAQLCPIFRKATIIMKPKQHDESKEHDMI